MPEGARHLLVCEHFAADAQACLPDGVRVEAYPARCGLPPLRWEELPLTGLPAGSPVTIVGGCCLSQLQARGNGVRIQRVASCHELLVDAGSLEGYLQGGTYVLTSAWLRCWRRHLAAWGKDPDLVREAFRENIRRLLCLDSGTGPEDLRGELAALGEALGLPWEVLPVDREHMGGFLKGILKGADGSSPLEAELKEARRQAADQALALEFLSDLSQSLHETEVKARMESFFCLLFGATRVILHREEDLSPEQCPEDGADYRETRSGFLVRLGKAAQNGGILEVIGLDFPQYRGYYLNLALSLAGACALALRNARTYQALTDAQSSQQLMLDVLDSFYRPGEDLHELERALDHIQAFTGAWAVAVRLGRGDRQPHALRTFTSSPTIRACGLLGPDTWAAPCMGAEGGRLAGLCGALLAGNLPPELPHQTPRGTFWTQDLLSLRLELQGLAGEAPPPCMQAGIRALALVPLHGQDSLLGLLLVAFREAGRITPARLDLLEGVAGSLALGLERRMAEDRLKAVNQELESRVEHRTAELAAINESLRAEMAERTRVEQEKARVEQQFFAAQKLEAIGTLAGGVAHDFNNILTPILGSAELGLLQAPEDSPVRRNFEMILKAGSRARDLVNQILVFSRRQPQDLRPLPLAPVVKEVLKLLRATLPSTLEIRSRIPEAGATVRADPTQIHQIVMNLCTNAAQAMEGRSGVLEVALDRVELGPEDGLSALDLPPGPYLLLQVSDTGCGMTPELVARIFEPFFTTKEPGKGTGLGLSVVHGLVKGYGGRISVYSEPGQGTVFRIYLPEIQGTDRAKPPEEPAAHPRGSERVLVVDDDESALQTLRSLLERLGYRVVAESSSPAALERVRREPGAFDLVVTDMTMPRLTGLDLAREIQGLGLSLPVILCSGYSRGLVPDQMEGLGIQAFIEKPYTLAQVARTLRKVLAP